MRHYINTPPWRKKYSSTAAQTTLCKANCVRWFWSFLALDFEPSVQTLSKHSPTGDLDFSCNVVSFSEWSFPSSTQWNADAVASSVERPTSNVCLTWMKGWVSYFLLTVLCVCVCVKRAGSSSSLHRPLYSNQNTESQIVLFAPQIIWDMTHY